MPARNLLSLLLVALLTQGIAVGQNVQNPWGPRSIEQSHEIGNPSSALRPLDAPSIVDRYKPRGFQNTSPPPQSPVNSSILIGQNPVQQTAYQITNDQQAIGTPALQGSQYQVPGNQQTVQPNQGQQYPVPQQPISPSVAQPSRYPQPQTYTQPIASVGSNPCISPPSTWTAGGAWDCGPYAQTSAVAPAPYVPPQTYNPNVITPDLAPSAYAPNNGGYRPLIALGSAYPNVQVGRGIIGQPTVYVPGQPIRNFFRYISP